MKATFPKKLWVVVGVHKESNEIKVLGLYKAISGANSKHIRSMKEYNIYKFLVDIDRF